ncbi:hypothetical protein GHT06_011388 [Daphnia sinensis]|uniref:Uncharacterized protein n=1 Tax=Daphnia sinensis TaxID=1820382 RepID=A0AAD5LJL0_9CRUS|nr:hypothetical protein GHT06_011388 [Daphnia sinensis]
MPNNRLLVIIVRNSNGVMSSVMIPPQTSPLMSHFSQKPLSRFPDKDYFFKTFILSTVIDRKL